MFSLEPYMPFWNLLMAAFSLLLLIMTANGLALFFFVGYYFLLWLTFDGSDLDRSSEERGYESQ